MNGSQNHVFKFLNQCFLRFKGTGILEQMEFAVRVTWLCHLNKLINLSKAHLFHSISCACLGSHKAIQKSGILYRLWCCLDHVICWHILH